MTQELRLFEEIRDALCTSGTQFEAGRMMSAPAVKHRGKVFAFLSRDGCMVFRLGKNFEPAASAFPYLEPFNPFKNKGPLSGWFQASYAHKADWKPLADKALALLQSE